MNMMQAGWLEDVTNWFREQFEVLFNALVQLLKDLLIFALEAVLQVAMLALEALSLLVPDSLANFSICGILANAGPTVQWAVTTFHIPEGMLLITAGFVFRMGRKALTLFQW